MHVTFEPFWKHMATSYLSMFIVSGGGGSGGVIVVFSSVTFSIFFYVYVVDLTATRVFIL